MLNQHLGIDYDQSNNRDRDRDHDRDHIQTMITLEPALLAITEEENKIEYLWKENAKLKAKEKQRKIKKSKAEKERESKVLSDHCTADALKAKLKSTGHSSNLCATVNQFGPKLSDASTMQTGTRPKISIKGDVKSDSKSPAKRPRHEKTHPVSADHKTYKTGPPLIGAGLKGTSKMIQKQGPRTEEKALFSTIPSRNPNNIGPSREHFKPRPPPTPVNRGPEK